jgi:hypothetical protein
MRLKFLAATLPALLLCLTTPAASLALDQAEFEKMHRALQLPTDEPWRTIVWETEITEACARAAKEKKPVVLRVRSGHPLGCV